MDLTTFLALGEPLKQLLLPIIFMMIVFLYKIGTVVLKLHVNDKMQDIEIQNLKSKNGS